jgi:peptide/nickel transport system substrate-binding protein
MHFHEHDSPRTGEERTTNWLTVALRRRDFVRLTAFATAIGIGAPLLAACGGDDDDDDDAPTATTADSGSGDPTATTSADADDSGDDPTATPAEGSGDDTTGEGQEGGELVIGNEQNPVSMDPHFVRDVGSSRAMFYMFDGLIRVNVETDMVPQLASSWELSDDGLLYTYTLVDGVTFHDGSAFNADAVKVNLDRHFDESLSTLYYDDFVQYVSSVDVVDEATVTITMNEIYVNFPRDILAFGGGMMNSPTALEEMGQEYAQSPVGTGPFVFDSFEQDSHLVMVRNEEYWQGRPYLDSIRVRIIPEQSVQIVELEAGNVDVGFSVQAKDIGRLEDSGATIVSQPAPTGTFISMNLAKGFTQELEVRQAIAMSVDREAVVSELLLGYGQVSRGGSPSGEGWPRYHEDIPMDEYNPEEAGRILEEAGWVMGDNGVRQRDGQNLKVNVLSTQLERALSYGLMNEIIQQSIEEIGFETEIQTMEWGAYLDEFRAGEWWEVTFHAQNASSRDQVGGTLDPDGYWNVNQHAKVTEGPLVDVADQIREQYDVMNAALDPQQAIDAWKVIQELIQEYQLISWLVHWDFLVAVASDVRDIGIKPILSDTIFDIHLVWKEQ